jgi:hypothetical protein
MNSKPEDKIKVSFDGEEYLLRYGEREVRIPRDRVLQNFVEAAAALSGLGANEVAAWKAHPGEDGEKWTVQPKDVVHAISSLRSSLDEAASIPRGDLRVDETAIEVGETFTYTGDRPFLSRVQVTALGRPSSRYQELIFRCGDDDPKCAECPINRGVTLDFTSREMDPSAFVSYFDSDNPRDALRVLTERGLKPVCMGWLRSVRIEGSEERAVTPAIVIDRQGTEGQAWFVHGPRCDLKRAPNWVTAMGWLCHGSRGRIGVLVKEFTTESEVMVPTDEERQGAFFGWLAGIRNCCFRGG